METQARLSTGFLSFLVPTLALVFCIAGYATEPSFRLHLKLDDGAPSTVASDSSPNGLDGVLMNMDDLAWQTGVAGLALQFDGVDDYVEVPNDDLLDFGWREFTVSYWYLKQVTSGGFDNLYGVSKWSTGASPGNNEWALNIGSGRSSDAPVFRLEVGTSLYGLESPQEANLLEWHHLVGVRRRDAVALYVDGVLVGEDATIPPDAVVNNNDKTLRLAVNQPAAPLFYSQALLDDLQIYAFAVDDGGVNVGDPAGGGVLFLFENPGTALVMFENSFEAP
ncbi:MAG: LamG domain-containing protein [Xanthomonadales bacterium]|nr:LamG domain-containing protein [Xanthomonadales bacterium]